MGVLDYMWIFSVLNAGLSAGKVLVTSISKYRSYSKLMKKFDRLFRRSTSAPDQCCTICLTELLNCRQLASCGHLFHYRCLFQWMQTKMECPICRVPIQLSWYLSLCTLSAIRYLNMHDWRCLDCGWDSDWFSGRLGSINTLYLEVKNLFLGMEECGRAWRACCSFWAKADTDEIVTSLRRSRNLPSQYWTPIASPSHSRSPSTEASRKVGSGSTAAGSPLTGKLGKISTSPPYPPAATSQKMAILYPSFRSWLRIARKAQVFQGVLREYCG